jgi:hypothetical protein
MILTLILQLHFPAAFKPAVKPIQAYPSAPELPRRCFFPVSILACAPHIPVFVAGFLHTNVAALCWRLLLLKPRTFLMKSCYILKPPGVGLLLLRLCQYVVIDEIQ